MAQGTQTYSLRGLMTGITRLSSFRHPPLLNRMQLLRSLKALSHVCREDAAFRRLGRPPGWSVWYHYQGRWHDRRGSDMAPRQVTFRVRQQKVEFVMSDKYLGAFKGVFLDREYDCAARFARPPERILDLGGNIGFGSVFFAGLFPRAKLLVVEPDPRNLPLLRTNLALNQVDAVVVPGAAGRSSGTLQLRFGDNPTCSSLSGTGLHDLADAVEVGVLTVPEIMARAGWDHIDLLKVDIEGAEEELLAGDNDWLSRVGSILVEIHPNTTPERLNGYLARHGFKLERFGGGREPVYFAGRSAP